MPFVKDVPHLMEKWSDKNEEYSPETLTAGNRKKAWWDCPKGHSWFASVVEVARGRSCGVCRGLQVVPGVNDFASHCPDKAKMWHPTKNDRTPEQYSTGSGRRAWFICENGHTFDTIVRSVSGGSWCRYCAGKDVYPGDNDLITTFPDVAAEWDYQRNGDRTPMNTSRGSNKDTWWICHKNPEHRWMAKPNDRTGRGYSCPKCVTTTSKVQSEVTEYIRDKIDVVENARGVLGSRAELDIYIPSIQVAFEVHGLYFHSDGPRGSKTTTKEKVDQCDDAGIDLYIVWEDDWRDKNSIVKKWIDGIINARAQEKIGARECEVHLLTGKESKKFLQENHIQGPASGKYYVGLKTKDGELVAAAVFSSWKGGDVLRLDRYATSCNVRGGFTKIISWMDKNVEFSQMETFADLTYSKGKLYENCGWTLDSVLRPDYKYLYNKKRVHKFNFRKNDFRDSTGGRKLKYEEGMTERELAVLNNIHRVYDAGKSKYTRKRNQVW